MRQVLVDHRLGVVSMSALSQSMPKSACAFPVISNASLVRSSSFKGYGAPGAISQVLPARGCVSLCVSVR